MTLDELADICLAKTQLSGNTGEKSVCKTFLSKKYERIYNRYLFKDSLAPVSLSVDPTTDPDNLAGIVLLPEQIERVVAMRNSSNRAIRVEQQESFYQDNYDLFLNGGFVTESGTWQRFTQLSPVWFTCRPGTEDWGSAIATGNITTTVGEVLKLISSQANDSVLYDAGLLLGGPYTVVLAGGNTGYYQAISTHTRAQSWIAGVPGPTISDGTAYSFQGVLNGQSLPGATLVVTSDSVDDLAGGGSPIQVKIIWRDATEQHVYKGTLPVTLTPQDGSGFIEVESVFKQVSAGSITFTIQNPVAGYSVSALIGTLLPADLRSPKHNRVQLVPAPAVATTINVLGKKPFIPLDFDNETPAIKNVDDCLIAFGCADLLERVRQYGKAAQKLQEAEALLADLARIETLQEATHQVMQPASGFGTNIDSHKWGNPGY